MKIFFPVFVLFMLPATGCGPSDDGFRFHGNYEAARSGYSVQILSKGYVEAGQDIARTAFAVVQFCPTGNSNGRLLQMKATAIPDQGIKVEARELGPTYLDWNANTSEGLVRGLLLAAGHRNIDPEELPGTVQVIENSLAGPKGVILKGQITSLRVIRADIETGYPVEKGKSPREWIEPSEVTPCPR